MQCSNLPIHHFTGLRAVGIVNGRPVWPIKGGSGEGEGEGGESGNGGGYTPPASQEDLNRIIEQRISRERAKFADYDSLKEKAARADALEHELSSETEKAVRAAREEERAKATQETTPRIVRAEFKAAAKGVLSGEQLSALLEDLNLANYVTASGDVDEDKVAKKIAAFAPPKPAPQSRSLGQGTRPPSQLSNKELGAAEAQKRFAKK